MTEDDGVVGLRKGDSEGVNLNQWHQQEKPLWSVTWSLPSNYCFSHLRNTTCNYNGVKSQNFMTL
jgi:hypothetical protein